MICSILSNPCKKRYRSIFKIEHELIKRSTKSSRRLGCLYYYIYIAPGETQCMAVIYTNDFQMREFEHF